MVELLQPGQGFAGRYRILRFLAKGGFGAVYVAQQMETELRVALKVLWPHVLFSQDAVEKFKLEAKIAGRVNSEHIVKVFDAGFDDATGMPFLVMEYLEGLELQRVVEQAGPVPAPRAVQYLRQISSALDRAHGYTDAEGVRRPIVHRDLKPENLFLSHRDDGAPVVKILDFGIAKVLNESTKVSEEVKGTPLYMAFEQASAGRITPQTDIWALGLIAFFLLTGKSYWKSANLPESSLTQLFGEVLSLPIDAPSQRLRELASAVQLPAAFDAWFLRCLQRDPAARFATAGQCVAALAQAFEVPDTARSPGTEPAADVFGATQPLELPGPAIGKTSGALAMARTGSVESKRGAGGLLALLGALALGVGGTWLALGRSGATPTAASSSATTASLSAPVAASSAPPAASSAPAADAPAASAAAMTPAASAAPSAAASAPVKKPRVKRDPWEIR